MAEYPFPNWIRAPDIAQEFSRGVAIGQQAAFEQQRLQMQQEENQRAHLMEQQRLEVEKSYRDQELAMRKQQLDQAMKLNQLKINDAAQSLDARNKYQQFIQSGGDAAAGLLKFGPAMDSGTLSGYASLLKLQGGAPPESPIAKLQFDRAQAVKRGDDNAIKQIDAAIQESLTNKGFSASMGLDDQGRSILNLQYGGAKPTTVATQSLSQSKLLQYANATELMSWLQQHLKPEHLGVAGKSGEFIVDKTLAQILPGAADKDRISVRSALDMAQGLAREIVDSPAGRFSNVERDAILGALPSTGFFEAYPDAIGRLQRAKEVLANRGRVYSQAIGEPLPVWSMSKDQIKQAYQQGKASGLKPTSPDFKKKGFLTEEEALDALQRYY